MLYVTTETITGRKFEELGIAMGNTIQSVHLGKDIMNSFKTLVGGELTSYNEMMSSARDIAISRMLEDADRKGADAVVCLRFVTNSIAAGAAEILAYGTAVRFTDGK